MSASDDLLSRIETYCRVHGMTERHFGLQVTNNHKLVPRLRAGHGVNSSTIDRVNAFIEWHEIAARRSNRSASAA